MNFTEPPTKVVWDENPQTAAALLAGQGYGRIRVERSYSFLAHWPFGARAVIPALADDWNHQNFRFYAGKPDPANPSQFTFDYDFGQQHGTVHGWLAADGTVLLKPDTGAMPGSRWYPSGMPPAAHN